MVDVNNRQEILAEVKRICESYVHNKEEVERYCTEQKRLDELKLSYTREQDKERIDRRKEELEAASTRCLQEILFFDSVVDKMSLRTRCVMRQLYVDEISWDFIRDHKGRPLSRDTIFRERRKAFNEMAEEYETAKW